MHAVNTSLMFMETLAYAMLLAAFSFTVYSWCLYIGTAAVLSAAEALQRYACIIVMFEAHAIIAFFVVTRPRRLVAAYM